MKATQEANKDVRLGFEVCVAVKSVQLFSVAFPYTVKEIIHMDKNS